MGQTKKWNKSAAQNGSVRTIKSTKAANICKAVQISIPTGDLTSSLRDIKKKLKNPLLTPSMEISRDTNAARFFLLSVYYYCKKKIKQQKQFPNNVHSLFYT